MAAKDLPQQVAAAAAAAQEAQRQPAIMAAQAVQEQLIALQTYPQHVQVAVAVAVLLRVELLDQAAAALEGLALRQQLEL